MSTSSDLLHFRFILPDGPIYPSKIVDFVGGGHHPLADETLDAADLYIRATEYFRGKALTGFLYLDTDQYEALPWLTDYIQAIDTTQETRRSILDEVNDIALTLKRHVCWNEGIPATSYYVESLRRDDKRLLQGLAVEAMMSADQAVCAISTDEFQAALHFLSEAYKNIHACSDCARRILDAEMV